MTYNYKAQTGLQNSLVRELWLRRWGEGGGGVGYVAYGTKNNKFKQFKLFQLSKNRPSIEHHRGVRVLKESKKFSHNAL